MTIYTLVLGEFETNCYLIVNEETNELIVADPADGADVIIHKIEENHWIPKAVFLTHGHWDHFLAAKEVAAHFEIPIVSSEDEKDILGDPKLNLTFRHYPGPETIIPDRTVKEGDEIEYAGMKAVVLHTPGHTKGSCCYYFQSENALIAGDTMFRDSYGRTDLPTGSMGSMYHSLKRLCTELPAETRAYPGHGPATTIGYESGAYDFRR